MLCSALLLAEAWWTKLSRMRKQEDLCVHKVIARMPSSPCGLLQEALSFDKVMRGQSLEMLKTLERWVERQATGLDMAANPDALKQSFDKLLKVKLCRHPWCSALSQDV